jgi:hypothetical protein
MARGPYLRDHLLPILERRLSPDLDGPSFDRFGEMCRRYGRRLGLEPAPTGDSNPVAPLPEPGPS